MTKKQEKEEKKRIRSAVKNMVDFIDDWQYLCKVYTFTRCYANFAYEECLKRDKRIRGDING